MDKADEFVRAWGVHTEGVRSIRMRSHHGDRLLYVVHANGEKTSHIWPSTDAELRDLIAWFSAD